jgi:hypothetical protein
VYDASASIDRDLFVSGSLPLPPIIFTNNLNNILYSGIDPQFIGGTQQNQYDTATTMSFTENQLIGDTTYMTIDDLRNITGSNSIPYMITSSGGLILKGERKRIILSDSSLPGSTGQIEFEGPGLCLLHSLNISTELQATTAIDPNAGFYDTSPRIGYPSGTTWDSTNLTIILNLIQILN